MIFYETIPMEWLLKFSKRNEKEHPCSNVTGIPRILSRQENARKLLNDTLFKSINTFNYTINHLNLVFRPIIVSHLFSTVNRVSLSRSFKFFNRSFSCYRLFRLDANKRRSRSKLNGEFYITRNFYIN